MERLQVKYFQQKLQREALQAEASKGFKQTNQQRLRREASTRVFIVEASKRGGENREKEKEKESLLRRKEVGQEKKRTTQTVKQTNKLK